MNVLLVDDDRFVIAALEKKIDWNSLGITDVYTACNVIQAQTIMTENKIDICVCDIEMPGKSGLDLLSWVRENDIDTLFIFLTSYADFNYAQKAIALSSMDYLLKPIDFSRLSQILEKATAQVRKHATWNKTQEESEHWATNYQAVTDLFWKDLFLNPTLKEISVLEHKISQKALPYAPTDLFLPILFRIYPKPELQQELGNAMVDFSFRNIALETLQNSCIMQESLVTLQHFEYLLIIGNVHFADVQKPLCDCLNTLFQNISHFLNSDVSCCIAEELPMFRLPDILSDLRNMRENNLSQINVPMLLSNYIPKEVRYLPPSLDILQTFLEQKNPSAALKKLKAYLNQLAAQKQINKEVLLRLRLDIEQVVFSFLQKNGIEAHTLFGTSDTTLLVTRSVESSTYMEQYLAYLITKASDYSDFVKEERSVVDLLLDYIHQHYTEDITRTTLSTLVYLNPDYMARLFKKQTGKSIISYITEYRIEKAKELLDSPDIPIGTVAAKVGYGNYSYFSKLFKDITGLTPNEYRKKSCSSSS